MCLDNLFNLLTPECYFLHSFLNVFNEKTYKFIATKKVHNLFNTTLKFQKNKQRTPKMRNSGNIKPTLPRPRSSSNPQHGSNTIKATNKNQNQSSPLLNNTSKLANLASMLQNKTVNPRFSYALISHLFGKG